MGTINSVEKTIIIADGETESGALALPQDYFLAGFILPAITTSTAITFKVSTDGTNFYTLYADGSAYSITIAGTGSEAITVSPSVFYPWEYIKVVVADAQSGDKTLKAVVRVY